ncbi:MAG: HEAT repeat domain-containing protein [Candidatus Bipolaricaulota bacterium]|nr:HEAT repeat domain-containing protein [Candidatus Bipolaricaulota bacterium]
MTAKGVLEAWRRGGASRDQLLVKLSEEDALAWAEELLPGPAEGRRLAAALLGRSPQPAAALEVLAKLAADEDRHVRDGAARAAGELLTRHFADAYPLLGAWRGSEDPLLRRAVAVAVGVAADPLHLERAEPLLRLLGPLLPDRAPEVRGAVEEALGTFFSAYPDDTFEHLVAWSASHDEGVLRHVATALGAAPAPLLRRALIVLRRVALSEARSVRRAAVRSLVRLAQVSPDPVAEELRRWLPDEERAPLAREALGRIESDLTRPVS